MISITVRALTSGTIFYLKHQSENETDAATGDTDDGDVFCCSVCSAAITNGQYKTTVNGEHHHSKSNPQGHQFDIRCFTAAPGCDYQGIATSEHSWFTGYRWNIALCGHCGIQLGWYFTGETSFFALVSDSIQECNQ